MSLLPARSAVEQGRLSGDCRSGRPVPTLPAAEGDMGLRLAWCAALAGAFAVGCGGDPKADPGLPPSGGPPPSEVAVAIRPAAVSLLPLQTQQFSADVSNAADRSVDLVGRRGRWRVDRCHGPLCGPVEQWNVSRRR